MYYPVKVHGYSQAGVVNTEEGTPIYNESGEVTNLSILVAMFPRFSLAEEYCNLMNAVKEHRIEVIPARHGDTVYILDGIHHKIWEQKVVKVGVGNASPNRNYIETVYTNPSGGKTFRRWTFAQQNKKWFLDKEKADEVLANLPVEEEDNED